jgi:hypothetical protein
MGVVSKHLRTGSSKWRSRQVVGKPQCGLLLVELFSQGSLPFAVMADGIMGIMASTVSKSLAQQAWARTLACVHVQGSLLARRARQATGQAGGWHSRLGRKSCHKSPPPDSWNLFRTWVWLAGIYAQPAPNGAAGIWLAP